MEGLGFRGCPGEWLKIYAFALLCKQEQLSQVFYRALRGIPGDCQHLFPWVVWTLGRLIQFGTLRSVGGWVGSWVTGLVLRCLGSLWELRGFRWVGGWVVRWFRE